ncbi:MAG: efflux transporter outer membrane subunit [Verrucomicrobiae bacterium]|nr:efflux transporter outer membrane subunit [Verrucomicrobiae bacterium]MCB1090754.1 efflux transporter outer membrane subunit [Verrucomicrobiae bacterium]
MCSCVTNQDGTGKLDPALTGQIPSHWTAARIEVPEGAATGWLDDFDSPVLKDLVLAAVERNHDLAATAARVEQAMARVKIAGADRLPQASVALDTARSQNLRGAEFRTVRANTFNHGLDLSWEVDLWGRVANLRRSAVAELDASSADYRAARLSLAANTAKTALDLVESRMLIQLATETKESLETNLEILDRKLEAGAADDRTALEISLSRADVARAKAGISQQERLSDASRRLLETLLGDYPAGKLEALTDLPKVKRSVPAGLPSELLLRRPDLVAAERRVDARLEDVAAARKALLPSIRLTAGAGTSTTDEFGDLFDIQNLVWNVGSNLTQPLFEGGRLSANVSLSEAELDEVAARYADSALTAFREVESALAAERYFAEQQSALSVAAEEATRAEQLSLSQYEKGLVDIITLLESQRRAFDSRSALLSIRRQRIANRIDLYLALGGDFDEPATVAPPSPSVPKPKPSSSARPGSRHR